MEYALQMDASAQHTETAIAGDDAPLIVGVTGHRDLVADEMSGIETAMRELLEDLARRFPGRRLQIMSPLAEGADRVVALIAEDLGLDLIVPLPMPEELYTQDFESSSSWAEFGRLYGYASERTTVPMVPGNTPENIARYGKHRNRQDNGKQRGA